MKVAFITLSHIRNIESRGIYTDLMRKFRDEGHEVYIITPCERRLKLETSLKNVDGVKILGVKTLNIQKTNILEKGLGTVLLESQLKSAVKKYLSDVRFDLILYSTPPITFTGVVSYLKKKNPKVISYLLLKDIFPQNAVDLKMFSKGSLLYKFFRQKEVQLYKSSDYIGCMSPANVRFLLEENPYINSGHVEVAPNSITLQEQKEFDRNAVRKKYNLPIDKPIFIYGGNLGKPQGIDYLIKCLEANSNRGDCHFLVVGGGTEYNKLASWYEGLKPENVSVFSSLPKSDYDLLVRSCDVGLIFLDHRFLIPNFPSRLLSYLEYKMPIIAATDVHTDIGTIAQDNGFGYWCESVSVEDFTSCVNHYIENPQRIEIMGEKGYQYLLDNYQTQNTFSVVMSHLKEK